MLTIKTTPNLYGISLQGDYQDLNALYDSISRYLDFYRENNDYFPYHQYEYLLSLNYDIRHAYMGTREKVIIKEDGGRNLYYSVNILYPLVFHYLTAFECILDDYILPWGTEKKPEYLSDYSMIQAIGDRAQMALFSSLVWENLTGLFGTDTAELLYAYYEGKEYAMPAPNLYIDALLHCQCLQFDEMSPDERRSFLLASMFEILGTEDLPGDAKEVGVEHDNAEEFSAQRTLYDETLEALQAHHCVFPTNEEFFTALEADIPAGQPLYEEVFNRFLDQQYGRIKDEDMEPDW